MLAPWPHKVPLASRRGGTEHPHRAPYLAVVRPTVMGTIENPKIDRWNRLEAVSLTVRAAWGKVGRGDGDSLLRDHPPPLSILLPSCTSCMQRVVMRAHAG